MKMILSLGILIILLDFLSGCSKDSDAPPIPIPNSGPVSLQNSWELRSVFGGYRAPGTSPNTSPGNKNIWKFTDSTYQLYSIGVLQQSGKYTLTKDTAAATGRLMDALIFDKNTITKLFFEFANDTLVLYRGTVAADGTIEKYVRIGNSQ